MPREFGQRRSQFGLGIVSLHHAPDNLQQWRCLAAH
jgi:hypothetical protein